uniref:Uncharacterized protein n=2 Tax=Ixodes scapularis TaxID=6945 RepID=A0A1S4L0V3_IXOSC
DTCNGYPSEKGVFHGARGPPHTSVSSEPGARNGAARTPPLWRPNRGRRTASLQRKQTAYPSPRYRHRSPDEPNNAWRSNGNRAPSFSDTSPSPLPFSPNYEIECRAPGLNGTEAARPDTDASVASSHIPAI